MFFLAAGLIFTVAMFAAAYYVFTVPEHEIGKTKVVMTLVGGKSVWP